MLTLCNNVPDMKPRETREEKATKETNELRESECERLYHLCNDTEKRFIDFYTKSPSKAKAAKHAGLSEKTAATAGWRMWSTPRVQAAIKAIQDLHTMSTRDVVKLVSDIASSNLADYYTKVIMVPFTPKVELSIPAYIGHLEMAIEDVMILFSFRFYDQEETRVLIEKITELEAEISSCKIEYRRNPSAIRIVDGQTRLVEEKVLDKDALIRDKERGRIKKVKINKDGSEEFELCSAEAAQERLLRRAGEYAKDNERKVVIAAPVIMDWGAPQPEQPTIVDEIKNNPEILD